MRQPFGAGRAAALGAFVAVTVAACAARETAVQRITRLRRQYDVRPERFSAVARPGGRPSLLAEMLVRNTGREGLARLTVVVRLVDARGEATVAEPVTLDTSGLTPGVAARLAVLVPGVELRRGEALSVELEDDPPLARRGGYPEYREVLSSGS